MVVLYILIGVILLAAIFGCLYCIGWLLGNVFPQSIFSEQGDAFLTALMGMCALLMLVGAVLLAYSLGYGVMGLFEGGK